ncbi:MAG: hypothetical protein WCK73_16125 [Deltaproteobacteria bacterium]
MATRKVKRAAPERPILYWVKGVPVHASADMRPSRKGEPVPRKRRLPFLESECVRSNDGIDFWLDSFTLDGAKATRLKVDARRRDPELFAEDMDPGLLGRLLFMLVNCGSEAKAPTLVLWGCRPRTRGRRWELYFLGREAFDFSKMYAGVLATSGINGGLEIDTRQSVPQEPWVAPLLLATGDRVALYNRDGFEVDGLRADANPPSGAPRFEVRLGTMG